MPNYATTYRSLFNEQWSEEDYKYQTSLASEKELEPIPPNSYENWELVSTCANQRTIFWTWRAG